ncbi:Haloacid dehalogenase-like hydrolase (HAD) superfamily protein [Zea mays]|uniref:Haloacid dehalogenase-like hydrolase (HAD) superfamily protein n=1 Tax=Zea mays TaxID=4577 RepID=A0A1D6JXZ4_MAIZE|nr:Haloacid dehalogenase-like hydrolase (HAD) superfamily protein [Zea mays]
MVHAVRALKRLGLEDCFEGIICFETLNPPCPPQGDQEPEIFFDDSVRNIQAGKQIGLHTVLVGKSQRVKGADHALESIHNIREALPELWEEAEKAEDVLYPERVAMETSVTA